MKTKKELEALVPKIIDARLSKKPFAVEILLRGLSKAELERLDKIYQKSFSEIKEEKK